MGKDFDKYKLYLKQYLDSKGVDTSQNPTFCIDPAHSNTNSPAMQIHEDGFNCLSCGVHGDIYDAAGLICGITDINEQYNEVEKTLGMAPIPMNTGAKKKKEDPPIDKAEVKKFVLFIKDHPARKKYVARFLKERGYPETTISKLINKYAYWPGFSEAAKVFNPTKAGLPEKGWYHSGVVCRLGQGFKLMYYAPDKGGTVPRCQKRNSKGAKAFPCPPPAESLTGTIFLTEAETSALSMRAEGFTDVYSTGSTNGITKNNADLLLGCDNIIFLFDGDNAGRYFSHIDPAKVDKKTGAESTPLTPIQKIWEAGYTGQIHTARLPENDDPDDLIQRGEIERLRGIISDAEEVVKPEIVELPPDPPPNEEKTMEEIPPFRFLGHDTKAYYALPKGQNIPLKLNRGDTSLKNMINEIATETWWFDKFNCEVVTKDGEVKTVFDTTAALRWFREESHKRGIHDENRLKGVGAHMDEGKIILNTGRKLKLQGNGYMKFEEWAGENFYVQSKRNFTMDAEPWNTLEGKEFWNQINTFQFEKKMDKLAVTGFMIMAPFSGILYRRPSIWITAQKGIGKSYLMEYVIVPAVGGPESSIFVEGTASEAFIRQSTQKDIIPINIDEFEAKNKKEQLNQERVLNLMRSSYGGTATGKGSADHTAIEFHMKSMFCFGSINVRMSNDGDRSRVHICRMAKSKGKIQVPSDFSGLRARTFSLLPKILEEIKICKSHILKMGLNDRIADTYSPFLVGSWNLISDEPFFKSKDDGLMTMFGEALEELTKAENTDDEDRIIERILQEKIRIDSSTEYTVAEMLKRPTNDMNNGLMYDEDLQRIGLRRFIRRADGVECIAISLRSPQIAKILVDTPFEDYKEVVQRHSCIIDKSFPVRMAGLLPRCALLDWGKFKERYLSDKDS